MGVLIVAEHASLKFGGEAALPLHYYRILRRRQIPVWLVVHERTRSELESLFPLDRDRIVFVPDTKAHLFVWRMSRFLPDRISNFTMGFILRYLTQVAQRREILRLIREHAISVIHQPIPVSPKEPSLIFGMNDSGDHRTHEWRHELPVRISQATKPDGAPRTCHGPPAC